MCTDASVRVWDSPAAGHNPRHDTYKDLLDDQRAARVAQTNSLVRVGVRANHVVVHEASVQDIVPGSALVIADYCRLQELQLARQVALVLEHRPRTKKEDEYECVADNEEEEEEEAEKIACLLSITPNRILVQMPCLPHSSWRAVLAAQTH